ncbi:MAG: HlyD family efflux transporter periplasmic adaptor subunit [Nevskia sp.]|nr:HlyD family efflux transporter periplasmic adaptor subunit [Nevskia sp.]
MNCRCRLIVAFGLLAPYALSAHEGHDDEAAHAAAAVPPSVASSRPHVLVDGQLYVPKAVQHALGLRTAVLAAQMSSRQLMVVGEVVADPNAAGSVGATQPGRLEAPEQGWPLPGRSVGAGEMLAYLRPLISQREQAQRRAALAQIDNDLQIAEINVARLKLQADANGSAENSGNVYYEQARLDWQGLNDKYRLESEALNRRVAIRATGGGVLIRVVAQPGDVVAEGQSLFEVADPAHLRIAVRTFDPALLQHLQSARLRSDDTSVTLTLRGQEPLAGQQGWRLLFDAQPALKTGLTPGQIVAVALQLSTPDLAQTLAEACVAGAGRASVWVHVAPERFERRSLPGCQFAAQDVDSNLSIAAGERVVTQGAALLSEYR